jgi:hypothetical protein
MGGVDIEEEPNRQVISEVSPEMLKVADEDLLGRSAGLAVVGPVDLDIAEPGEFAALALPGGEKQQGQLRPGHGDGRYNS